jgi:hypothetical protein
MWLQDHWTTLVQWCEGEFIARTIAVKTDTAPDHWVPIATRLTILEVHHKAQELGSPLSVDQLIARYRRRNWLRWMRQMDDRAVTELRHHKALKSHPECAIVHRGRVQR